jgi:hypothetical protein
MMIVLVGACALFAAAALYLHVDREDLRWKLGVAERDAKRWKEEAVKRGWKNPFEEVAASLEAASNAVLKAVADTMRQTAERQKKNAEALGSINQALKKANGDLASQLAHLERARQHMENASRALRPAPKPAADADPRDRMVREAVRKMETDVITGQLERDPRKLN